MSLWPKWKFGEDRIGQPKEYRLNGGTKNGEEHLREHITSKEIAPRVIQVESWKGTKYVAETIEMKDGTDPHFGVSIVSMKMPYDRGLMNIIEWAEVVKEYHDQAKTSWGDVV